MDAEETALSKYALDANSSTVSVGNVLDDGQPKSGASKLAAPGLVHPVKPLEQAREMILGNPATLVFDADHHIML